MLRIRGEFEPDWSAVVKNLHQPIFALDSNGKIIVWNLGAEKLFGYPDQEMPSVSADKKRFKQILLNFLSNAFKYNRVGGKVSLECLIVGNERLKILVSDTGQGIAEDKYHLVFEAFERLDFEESNVRGTGIGLTVTKRIVESMGGEIGFSSVVGEGSTFWFPLPLATETP